jgi:dTDP-4-dehydrorhamnose 3,5-epimerase
MDTKHLSSLEVIEHVDGDIFKILQKTSHAFVGFGEAYFSSVFYGKIKGWKLHHKMNLNIVVPIGTIKFVLIEKSLNNNITYYEYILSQKNYMLLSIPPKTYFAFKGIGRDQNMLLNISDIIHNDNEVEKLPLESFNYDWEN